jgi:16S rRNA (guanine527-N7)-methyltransferase
MSEGGRDWRAPLKRRGLDLAQVEQIAVILTELGRDEHAPMSPRDARDVADLHVADSLVGLDFDEIRAADVIADLGSGGGFPGTALAVALPDAQMRLVESQRRKCEFLRNLCELAGIANAEVVCERAENWRQGTGAHDAVLARALAPPPVGLEYAAPLLRPGGALLDGRGRRVEPDERAAAAAAQALGMRLREVRHVHPFPDARDRHVHVFIKSEETPSRFPRRAGMARKRPLGA